MPPVRETRHHLGLIEALHRLRHQRCREIQREGEHQNSNQAENHHAAILPEKSPHLYRSGSRTLDGAFGQDVKK